MADEAAQAREHMLEALAMYSDDLMELLLGRRRGARRVGLQRHERGGPPSVAHRRSSWARPTRTRASSRFWDAIVRYLPSPLESENEAYEGGDIEKKMPLTNDVNEPAVAMAFKIVEDPFGALTFMRIYQGQFSKGDTLYNQRTGKKDRFSRIVRMHADQREEVDTAQAGDIVAGARCRLCQRRHLRLEVSLLHATKYVRAGARDQGRNQADRPRRR